METLAESLLDRRRLYYTNLLTKWIVHQEVYRTIYDGRAGHPYIKQRVPHLEGMQFF